MKTTFVLGSLCLLALAFSGAAQTPDKGVPKKAPPFIQELLKKSPEEFIKQFDKNNDGFLQKEELPPFLAKNFEKFDRNGDGKLSREEVAQMLQEARQFLAKQQPNLGGDVDTIVANLLKQFDTDNDGKISKKEAKGKLLEDFDKIDQNKDGYLDRTELRALAEVMLQKKGGAGGVPFGGAVGNQPDFDALDKNADGRLTKEELKGTPWLAHFAEIDTNGDGQIDRREWEAYLRKTAEKK